MRIGTNTGEIVEIPEDTIDLSERLDPVRTLLRRIAGGDHRAARGLVDLLAPRVHGLAVQVTGSSARAERISIAVLRSCLRDAAQLATGGLPGEVAVLDRARRAAVSTSPRGTVRSLISPEDAADRTRDRREIEVQRVLLTLPPADRALVESAAQGRFPYPASDREDAATVLAEALERLVPSGPLAEPESGSRAVRALAALDALALATAEEQARLTRLSSSGETVLIHRRAIEAAARLTLLTAVTPSRDLRVPVLEGFPAAHLGSPAGPTGGDGTTGSVPAARPGPAAGTGPTAPSGTTAGPAPSAPSAGTARSALSAPSAGAAPSAPSASAAHPAPAVPSAAIAPGPEAPYRGSYATPVLGTDSQRRLVGPPAVAGTRLGSASLASPATPLPSPDAVPDGRESGAAAPAFAYTGSAQGDRSRRRRRAEARAARRRPRGAPWISRTLAVLGLIGALVLGLLLLEARDDLARTEEFSAAWAAQSMDPSARFVPGVSDNGTWQAVLTDTELALRAEGVRGYDGEVLQLWGEQDGALQDLGVLELQTDGTIELIAEQGVERLLVTREMSPQNMSGTPSERIVASLDPAH
ncbi:hypothetical protein [Brachybacterium sp. J153]|uniref:hypothetical protein n=1 Tax=Brachybacterium sp. J153 TaxID=3116488 RepID=UPI002E778B80|nr:hypothetical protein [Brachybacterium sp. J153]MEE1619249.1 hypothetical protein [Brachybacterium sp. J153]